MKKDNEPQIMSTNQFPVIGIGASAGGLDAFRKLVAAIPKKSGMAYVLVQHLAPTHESLLPGLIQKVAAIPVLEIADDMKVEADHIYIIPSNKMLVANDGVLQLSPRPASSKNERNLPIDLFFTSLAEIHQSHAIGIVLSGTASDGTQGLKAIKNQGGITFAQDLASAEYDGMPHNAIEAGVVDFILLPEEMPQKLIDIKDHIVQIDENLNNPTSKDQESYKQIIALLRLRKGTDFTFYKQTTIRRRILRRIALNKQTSSGEYLTFLRENKEEQEALYQDLLIPVTDFFRDKDVFENLCEEVIPTILKNKASGLPVRFWVSACSTGQEAYSIAICFKESLGDGIAQAQIFATDINEVAIAKARKGIYTLSELENVSPERLKQHFVKAEGGYQLTKQIRSMCIFAVHNFLKDPPFGRMDFISCRNVLIYMEPYLQKKALTTFHYALNSKGYLLLGKAETATVVPELFGVTGKQQKLFSRKDAAGRFVAVASPSMESKLHQITNGFNNESTHTDFKKTADDIMLATYTPASVVVNDAMDIVHFRGNTSKFLEQAPGKPSHNLLKMAKPGLAFELRNLLHKAKKTTQAVSKDNILAQLNEGSTNISIEVISLPNLAEPHYLVMFHDTRYGNNAGQMQDLHNTKVSTKMRSDEKDLRILQLEQELLQTHEDMRSITEDQEAANEELQSANEELLSGSEELQSLNEEMESSKEELQSTNEELTVVNQELLNSNEYLDAARAYAEAIINTLPEPLLVLDSGLRVLRANGAFYKAFGTNPKNTESVLIYNLGNKQWNIPQLRILLDEILPEKQELDNFEVTHVFPGLGERVMLLNAREILRKTSEDKMILLAIRDITELKQHERKEKEYLNRFRNLILEAPVAICILESKNYLVDLANDFYLELIEKDKDFIGLPFFTSLPELETQGFRTLFDNVVSTGNPYYGNEVEVHISRKTKGEQGYFNFVYQPLFHEDKSITGLIIVATEVTAQVKARQRMESQALMVQNMLMTAPGFICTLKGPTHIYDLINARYQQLFGSRKIQGKPMLEALPELAGQGLDTLLDEVYRTGVPYVGIEIPITIARDVDLEPELRYFNFSYQAMYNEDQKIDAILIFGYEVTEEVRAKNNIIEMQRKYATVLEEEVKVRTSELSEVNEMLLQKYEEVQIMNKELEAFNYISSHDLQEPLRKIQSYSLRIMEQELASLSEKGKKHFQVINNAANRMRKLIDDLLAYSHMSTGEHSFQKTDLTHLMREVVYDFAESIHESNAVINFTNLGEAMVNPFQFRQLFNNLLSNSLKFKKAGVAPVIDVTANVSNARQLELENESLVQGQLSPKETYCHISFKDNGIGFDSRYSQKIFEVFQRLHGKEAYEGTGIGLAIVKKIVENHNGIITARGILGDGAIFDIYLPESNI